ncbi:MAG: MFS transporter [Holophagaceae bacterium]|uniref:MFS transporter n=1 Tax=Candidatus Geothrix skivensis TaxID=2954439 RepID=A0A9D7SD04_9BACT|nr:MFS transporter [Candidatus Geothrix skivensis]
MTDLSSPRTPLVTRQFALMWALTFVTFFAAFQLFPTVPLRLRELGASLAESGRFMSLFTAGSALGALFTGPLGDRLGHRRLVIASALLFAGFLGAYALTSTRWGFYLLAFPHGIVWSGLLTATMASMAHVLPEDRRADGLSLFGLASPGGVIVGPVLGLWIMQHWGFAPIGAYLAGLFVLLGVLATSLPVDHPHGRAQGFLWPDAAVIAPCLVLFGVALGYGAIGSYTAQEGLALGMQVPSVFLSCMAVGMVLMRIIMLKRGFGRRPIRKLPGMLLGAFAGMVLLAALPGGTPRHVVSALLYGAGYSMLHTLLNAKLLESVDPKRRGSAFGALLFAFDAGIGLGAFSLGWVIGHYGYRMGWVLGALALIAALPLALKLSRD